MIYAFIAVFFAVLSNLIEKVFFRKNRRLADRGIIGYLFLFAFFVLSLLLFPRFGEIDRAAFELWPAIGLVGLVSLATAGNILYYYGFPREDLSEIQPFVVFTPFLTLVIAGAIFPEERHLPLLLLAIIALLALILSHIKDRKLKLDPGLVPIAASVVFFASEVILAKYLLNFYSPVALYTVRVGFVAIMLMLVFRPSIKLLLQQNPLKMLLVPLGWIGYVVFFYLSVSLYGVVETSLVMMLVPLLTVLGSVLVLKEERVRVADIIALVIVLSCVVIAQILIP